MSTEKRRAANRANAAKSTGPRTPAGLARAAGNALAHGLLSARPVLPGESAADWDRHRAGVVAALRPVGGLEEPLADRVAGCLWRLRRAVGYEAAVTAVGLEEAADPPPPARDAFDPDPDPGPLAADRRRLGKAEKELADARGLLAAWADAADLHDRLADLPDDAPVPGDAVEGVLADLSGALPEDAADGFEFEDPAVLTELGVPAGLARRPFDWPGWTAGAVRRAAGAAGRAGGVPADRLLADARAARRGWLDGQARVVAGHEARVADLAGRVEAAGRRAAVRRMLPDGPTLDKVTRYEAHLSRQMLQALHTLERLQAARAGKDVPPPAAGTLVTDGAVPEVPPAG